METSISKEICKPGDTQKLSIDELFEIFSRMPAKAVIKFSCTSKILSSLLLNPYFVQKQLLHSFATVNGFFIQAVFLRQKNEIEFHVLPGEHPSSVGVHRMALPFISEDRRIVASSHGLLLLDNRTRNPVVFNPATMSAVELHGLPVRLQSTGIVFECYPRNLESCRGVNDYIVIVPIHYYGDYLSYELAVYCNGKWEKHDHLSFNDVPHRHRHRYLRMHNPVALFKGHRGGLVIHYLIQDWLNYSNKRIKEKACIVGYDIDSKTYTKKINLPKGAWNDEENTYTGNDVRIFKYRDRSGNESILFSREHWRSELDGSNMYTVWLLDYELGSWRLMLKKTLLEMGVPKEIVKAHNRVLGVVHQSGLLFKVGAKVFLYEMESRDAEDLKLLADHRGCDILEFIPYSNTLCSV